MHIVILGGGASGVLTAANLLPRLNFGDSLTLVERNASIGYGVAYGPCSTEHLLNVRAGNMSAFPQAPDHFVKWLVERHLGNAETLAATFVGRRTYGDYLASVLQTECVRTNGTWRTVQAEADSVEDTGKGLIVHLRTGQTLDADACVLALGNLPPRIPAACRSVVNHPRFIANPWMKNCLHSVGKRESVFILGTGLTMLDVVVSLYAEGREGRITARSRHGLLPQGHRASAAATPPKFEGQGLFEQIIRYVREGGDEWRGAIDGLRSQTPAMWQSLSWEQRRRFLSRLQTYWDVHRHRAPSEQVEVLEWLMKNGRLSAGVGCIERVTAGKDNFHVELTSGELQVVDWIVNCTGPETSWMHAQVPLVESLVKQGLAQYDPLGLGLEVDGEGRVGDSGRLWSLGPLCRGCRWETTAIPEIRVQARALADQLV